MVKYYYMTVYYPDANQYVNAVTYGSIDGETDLWGHPFTFLKCEIEFGRKPILISWAEITKPEYDYFCENLGVKTSTA